MDQNPFIRKDYSSFVAKIVDRSGELAKLSLGYLESRCFELFIKYFFIKKYRPLPMLKKKTASFFQEYVRN